MLPWFIPHEVSLRLLKGQAHGGEEVGAQVNHQDTQDAKGQRNLGDTVNERYKEIVQPKAYCQETEAPKAWQNGRGFCPFGNTIQGLLHTASMPWMPRAEAP